MFKTIKRILFRNRRGGANVTMKPFQTDINLICDWCGRDIEDGDTAYAVGFLTLCPDCATALYNESRDKYESEN